MCSALPYSGQHVFDVVGIGTGAEIVIVIEVADLIQLAERFVAHAVLDVAEHRVRLFFNRWKPRGDQQDQCPYHLRKRTLAVIYLKAKTSEGDGIGRTDGADGLWTIYLFAQGLGLMPVRFLAP